MTTHVREVARREYKNLAKQFQDVWREDGTLRNLHRQKWWYEDAEGVPPLASDVAGMMHADPGRFDVVDDAQPTHACAVAQKWREWARGHALTCKECDRVVQAAGGTGFMPGDLPASCPCNFRLIAHRLRVGLTCK